MEQYHDKVVEFTWRIQNSKPDGTSSTFLAKVADASFFSSWPALIMAQPGLTDDQFMDYADMETSLESMGH